MLFNAPPPNPAPGGFSCFGDALGSESALRETDNAAPARDSQSRVHYKGALCVHVSMHARTHTWHCNAGVRGHASWVFLDILRRLQERQASRGCQCSRPWTDTPLLIFLFADSAAPSFLKIRTTRFWKPGVLLLVSEDSTRWSVCRRRGNCVSAYKTTLQSVASLLKPRLRRWKSGSR